MLRSISSVVRTNILAHRLIDISCKQTLKASFVSKKQLNQSQSKQSLFVNTKFFFGSETHSKNHPHNNNEHGHHSHGQDPLVRLKRQYQAYAKQLQQKYPNQPQQVIREIYSRCQQFIGQNKKAQIFLLFQILSEFIQTKNLVETYSSFTIMSAKTSFLMGRHKQVERRCRLALPYQIKKHGEMHLNIADIYNMLGISITSKSQSGKGKQALQYLEKAFKIRNEILKQSPQTAQILFNAAIIEQEHQNMFENAQKKYLDAIQMLEDSGLHNPVLYLKAKMRLADVQFKIHNVIPKHVSDLLRIEEMILKFKSDQIFTSRDLSQVDMFSSLLYKNLGKACMEAGDFPKAIKYFEMCLDYLRQNKMETQDRIFVLQHCATCYVALNDYEKAAKLFEQGDKVLGNLPVTDNSKYNFWRYLAKIYRKSKVYLKEIQTLQRMRNLQKNTKQTFVKHADICEVEMSLIFALGNAQKFDEVIIKGEEVLKFIQSTKGAFQSVNRDQDYKSNIYAYIGYAHLSKGAESTALQYFEKSDKIFSSIPSTGQRIEFHINILKKLALLEIKLSKNLQKGFMTLERLRNLILSNQKNDDRKKLKDLIVLLLDYEIAPTNYESTEKMVEHMIQSNYVQNINGLLEQIIKILRKLSQSAECKEIIENCYFLVVSTYQMLLSFNNDMKSYQGKYEANSRTLRLLNEAIGIYDKTFAIEIEEVSKGSFKGEETLKDFIQNVEGIKKDLQKFVLTK